MAKDPAFLFYPSDFLTGTMFMSNEDIGIYIRLLCSQHQHGGLIDKLSFNSLVGEKTLLKSKFIETETGFYNERLADEMGKRNKKSNNLSDAAKDVWIKRKNDKNTIVQKNHTIVLQKYNNSNTEVIKNDTIVIQPVNRNEDRNKDNIVYLKVKEQIFKSSVSEYIKTYLQIWLDNENRVNTKPVVEMALKEIDIKYFGYSFRDENHICKSFQLICKNLKTEVKTQGTGGKKF